MELKKMSDSELSTLMVNLINRIEHLRKLVANFLDNGDRNAISADRIKNEYSVLKKELREYANYLNLVRNQNGSVLYMRVFSPSIREASAYGFTVAVNRSIDMQMYSAIETARYKLTKIKTLEEWGELM